jgi:hypothetical protein
MTCVQVTEGLRNSILKIKDRSLNNGHYCKLRCGQKIQHLKIANSCYSRTESLSELLRTEITRTYRKIA